MLKNPCRDCNDRNAECHGICTQYIEFEKANAALRSKIYPEVESYKKDNRSAALHKQKYKR